MNENFETIRGLLANFDQAAKDCRLAKEPCDGKLKRLWLAQEAALTEVGRLKAGGYKSGICVFRLPDFGYPELYIRRVLDEIFALTKASEKPG
jgi:hypothetical protein